MYTSFNYRTKKALREAIVAGKKPTYFQPGLFGGNEPQNGIIYLEGPHYPAPHTWYATAMVDGGIIVSIR